MGKLTNMVAEESSFSNRVKYNARRVRFAGIGLFGKLDQQRERMYQQIVEKGNGNSEDGVVASLNALSAGVLSIAREESQRVFDELVVAGEAIAKSSKPAAVVKKETAKKETAKKVTVKQETAKKGAPVVLTAVKSSSAKKVNAKPAVEEAPAQAARKQKEELIEEEIMLAFGDAKDRVKTLGAAPDQATQLALYALFKQGEDGDVKGRRPAMTKMVERAKFDARRELKGMTKSEAIDKYVAKVDELVR